MGIAQGQMTANVFPSVQIEQLTVKAAAAVATCAEGVRDLPYERWKLPGVEICKDGERVLSITEAMRNFDLKHWKVDDNNALVGKLKLYLLRFTPPVLWPLAGTQSSEIFPLDCTFLINGAAVHEGRYGYVESSSWLQTPSSSDTGPFHCVIYTQDLSATDPPSTQTSATLAGTDATSAQEPPSPSSADPSV